MKAIKYKLTPNFEKLRRGFKDAYIDVTVLL